ncbi:MAG TPA: hypothetical protein DDZ39_10175 [Flavobacteriaceae bacterium]|jgi:Mlc titration factor MtfA (ptsG expression regulator)|nr:hypothetical protein [Flavobacteriaceae bacterium]
MINPIYFLHKTHPSLKKVLKNNIDFYKRLNAYDKLKFEYRVSKFIKKHNFVGRGNVVISPVKKVIISSIAIMITFKMQNYLYKHFENILIYPSNFLSKATNQMHKGETNPKVKAIVFSWEGFVKGIQIPDDNLNLGIHEFTHALYFSFLKQNDAEAKNFIRNYKQIVHFTKDPLEKKKLVKANYLRDYAFENQHEFFAVITENYFETPLEFRAKLPELFMAANNLYRIYNHK